MCYNKKECNEQEELHMKSNLKVQLIAWTQNPEQVVAASAKLCYSAAGAMELMEGLDAAKTEKFVEMLGNIGHESPIEHASFSFAVEGISRSLLAQITRHRLASFSVQSQRYVKLSDFTYVTPPEIAADPDALEVFERSVENCVQAYKTLSEILEKRHYTEFLSQGLSEKAARSKAEKKAIEDARFVLPNAAETKMVITMNARELLHFFRLRCCNRAQWEIRALAKEMLRQVYEKAPHIFAKAGPACCFGACPEGKMSCGRSEEVRAEFAGIKGSGEEQPHIPQEPGNAL